MVEYILRNGEINSAQIWYHQWPSFFLFFSSFVQVTGTGRDLLLNLFPLGIAMITALFSYNVFKLAFKSRQIVFAAVWIVVCMNWVNQDFFGPQAISLLFYIMFLWLLFGAFVDREKLKDIRFIGLFVTILAFVLTLHLLTALMIFLNVGCLIIFMRTGLLDKKRLAMLIMSVIAVATAVFILYPTKLSNYLNDTAKIELVVETLIDARLAGGNSAHTIIVAVQIIIALSFMAMAGGALLKWKGKRKIRSLMKKESVELLLAVILFSNALLVFYHYGGENVMRIFLYSLIPLSILALFFMNRPVFRTVIMIFIIASPVMHVFGHYANENIDYIPAGELRGADIFNENMLDNSTIVSPSGHSLTDIANHEYYARLYFRDSSDWRSNVTEEVQRMIGDEHLIWIGHGDRMAYLYLYDENNFIPELLNDLDNSIYYNKIYESPYFSLYVGV